MASSDVADVVVVSSALNIFSAGADVKAMKRLSNAERIEYFRRVGRLLSRLESVPFWTVSLVEGKAIGAGADLSLACDFVFASSEAMWSFPGYLNGIRLGVKRLVARVGPSRAFGLMALGRKMGRDEAVTWGAVYEYTNREQLFAVISRLSSCHGSPSASRAEMFGSGSAVEATKILENSLTENVVSRF